MDSLAILCRLKQPAKDTLIASMSRSIEAYKAIAAKDSTYIANFEEANTDLQEQNNKLSKKAVRNFKLGAIFGLIIGIATQLIF